LKILVNGVKLPFLMQGKVGKRHFLCSATPDFFMGVAGFVVQHPFTETLKDTLLLKFHAIRFHVLTSFRVERWRYLPFSRDNTGDFFKRRMRAKLF
jgi:hypothetical protein